MRRTRTKFHTRFTLQRHQAPGPNRGPDLYAQVCGDTSRTSGATVRPLPKGLQAGVITLYRKPGHPTQKDNSPPRGPQVRALHQPYGAEPGSSTTNDGHSESTEP